MPERAIVDLIDTQRFWLDPLGDSIGNIINRAKRAGGDRAVQVLDILHGVWLGHPLHPALTDVPIGAWTVACAMDAIGEVSRSESLKRYSDGAIALGIVGGIGAAASGLADWHHLGGRNRRLGVLHGLLNLSAVTLYTTALILRLAGRRGSGNKVAALSYALASFSAYLGGELVFGSGIGVDHAAWQKLPRDFVPVLPDAELGENQPRRVHANGTPVLLLRRHGQIHAMAETCTHLGGPLSEGSVADDSVICPWHGSQFALDSGRVIHGPATFPEALLEVRVRDGQIEVRRRR